MAKLQYCLQNAGSLGENGIEVLFCSPDGKKTAWPWWDREERTVLVCLHSRTVVCVDKRERSVVKVDASYIGNSKCLFGVQLSNFDT